MGKGQSAHRFYQFVVAKADNKTLIKFIDDFSNTRKLSDVARDLFQFKRFVSSSRLDLALTKTDIGRDIENEIEREINARIEQVRADYDKRLQETIIALSSQPIIVQGGGIQPATITPPTLGNRKQVIESDDDAFERLLNDDLGI